MTGNGEKFTEETIITSFIPPIAKTWENTITVSELEFANRFNHFLDTYEVLLKSLAAILYGRIRHYNAISEIDEFLRSRFVRPTLGTFPRFIHECQNVLLHAGDPWAKDLEQALRMRLSTPAAINICRIAKELQGQEWNKTKVPVIELFFILVEFRNRTRGHGVVREELCKKVNHDFYKTLVEIFSVLRPALEGEWYAVQSVQNISDHEQKYEMYRFQGLYKKIVTEILTDTHLINGRLYASDSRLTPPWIELWPLAHWENTKKEIYLYNTFSEGKKTEFVCYTSGDVIHLEGGTFEELFDILSMEERRSAALRASLQTATAAAMILKGKSPSGERDESLMFVTYAGPDNQPPQGLEEGEVTRLIKRLKILLSQKLERKDAYSLWIDYPADSDVQVPSEMIDAVHNTPILLVILSRNYLASDWCRSGENNFLGLVKENARTDSNVFIIERDRLNDEERPPEFDEVTGHRYPFWDEFRYHNLLNDLSYDLADELRRRKKRTEILTKKISPVSDDRPVVLLADVTDDLYPVREEVERSLRQTNLRVLPEEAYYPYEPRAFQQAVRDDLAQSQLFIQLLSGLTGKRPREIRQSRARCQYELALEAGKPVLQWRSPELDIDTVQDPDQRALLRLETVLAAGIEEFTAEIVNRVTPQKPSAPAISPDIQTIGILLFLDANISEDSPLITQICQVFDRFGVGYMLPLQSEKPSKNREAFEQYVLHCDALVIVYGEVSVKWVSDQLLAIRKISWKREQPLTAFAIFDGPPPQKPPVNIKLPNMRILQCRDCVDEEKLLNFIESLQKEKM